MTVFTRVVELGSFTRAAQRLDMSASAASRHVADLEAHLDVRLLNRTTRTLSLTESGAGFHERAVQLLADLEEAEAAVTASAVTPRGTLKVTCGITFGERHVAPAIAAFAAPYRDLKFDVELSDRMVDLVDEGFDIGIRIGEGPSQALIARRIGEAQLVCCASPDYLELHGTPERPADLARHRCLSYAYAPHRGQWRFRDATGAEKTVRITGPLSANSGRFLAVLAAASVGIALEPDFIVDDELASGRLVELLSAYRPAAIPIYAVYPSRRHLSAKVRAFVDFMAAHFAVALPQHAARRRSGRRAHASDGRRARKSPH
ncbi:MAG TPA: LysR family transcriptional regulator [Casimicrobiaceae bacterium]|nr:LysR family transcriptional regulator [Casimicrobiaceae bacterium]